MGTITVQFGNFSGDQRNLTKTLENGTNITCEIYEDCSIYNPRFVLDYNSSYIGFNYAYVEAWNRYYFITGQDLQAGKRIVVRCHCDVLNSFGSQIKNSQFRVQRCEVFDDPYIPDNGYIYEDLFDVINYEPSIYNEAGGYIFGEQNVDSYCYVLGINGGTNIYQNEIPGFTLVESEPTDWSARFMYYYVNLGTSSNPQMKQIGQLIFEGEITSSDASNYQTVVSLFGRVYQKN